MASEGVRAEPAAWRGSAGCPRLTPHPWDTGEELLSPGPSAHVCQLNRAELTRNV